MALPSAAWAFVRPFEIDKGIQLAVAAKDTEDKNAIALAEAQAALEQNNALRPMKLQDQRQVLEYNTAIRPIQLAAAQLGLEQSQQLSPLALKQAQLNLDQQTYKAVDAQTAFNANQIFKSVAITPGEAEDSVLKKYLGAITSTQDPSVKNALTQQVNQMAPGLALQALNRGDPTAAQNVLLAMNNGPIPTLDGLRAMSPGQQVNLATNNQVSGTLPNPAMQLEAVKQQNALGLKAAVSGDTVIRETNDMAGKSIIPMSTLAQEYTRMIMEAQKTGMPLTMTFEQYAAQFQGNRAQPVNSVSGPRNTTGPGGVPYK